jgi:hypothetical protein
MDPGGSWNGYVQVAPGRLNVLDVQCVDRLAGQFDEILEFTVSEFAAGPRNVPVNFRAPRRTNIGDLQLEIRGRIRFSNVVQPSWSNCDDIDAVTTQSSDEANTAAADGAALY